MLFSMFFDTEETIPEGEGFELLDFAIFSGFSAPF